MKHRKLREMYIDYIIPEGTLHWYTESHILIIDTKFQYSLTWSYNWHKNYRPESVEGVFIFSTSSLLMSSKVQERGLGIGETSRVEQKRRG